MTTSPPPAEADRLILAAARGQELTADELRRILAHVALVGFDPHATERARGTLAGIRWRGRALVGRDRIPAGERHYIRHVLQLEEWPRGTSFENYVETIRQVILDPASGVFISRYQGAWQLGVVRQSGELRGPSGSDWVLVKYRVDTGHWTTAFQPNQGLNELQSSRRGDLPWLRQPRPTDESTSV